MKSFQEIEVLGSGIGYRSELHLDITHEHERIDFIEIVGDHFMFPSKRQKSFLRSLADDFIIIPHFIGLNLGSEDEINKGYLKGIKELINVIDAPYWSEHIAFCGVGGMEIGHLTPLPYSQKYVDVLSRNIDSVSKSIKSPLILENISYTFSNGKQDFSETEFINKVLDKNDVGLLLDITNLFANSLNQGFDWKRWLEEIDLNRVVQIHYVGVENRGDVVVDTHAANTQDEVWEIMEHLKGNCTNLKGALLERDQKFSNPNSLLNELEMARNILF
jgi:uncharacterized protein